MGCGVDVAAEFGDLVTEFLAVRLLELAVVLNRYDDGGHGGFPAKTYTVNTYSILLTP
jgi:hypothetical protein